MKEPSVEALVEEAKLWTTDALVRDTLDALAQRIETLEGSLETAHVAGIYKQQRDRYRSAHAGLEAKVETLTRELEDYQVSMGHAASWTRLLARAEAAEAKLAEALTVALEYRAITDRLLRSLRGET